MKAPDYTKVLLPNGITLVHKQIKATRLVHCGYIINAGSRNDEPYKGMAHALEHMVFKGTEKRKTWQIISYLENVGGELNAYTTKDYTAIYTSLHKKFFGRALDLISDIVFHSTFPKSELQKEKKVILEEINMYQDSPEESIMDEFQEQFFGAHPLAHNILGTPKDVSSIEQKTIKDFHQKFYNTSNAVLSIVGNIRLEKAQKLASQIPVSVGSYRSQDSETKPTPVISNVVKETPTHQGHIVLGCMAPGNKDESRWITLLLNNILGGPAMNSRLNLAIREKHGLAYHTESAYQMYTDCGLFTVYIGCDSENLKRCETIARQELNKLATKPLGKLQLSKAKNQLMGQAVIAEESYSNMMLHLGKAILRKGKALSFEEAMDRINSIAAEDIMKHALHLFEPKNLASLTYKPKA